MIKFKLKKKKEKKKKQSYLLPCPQELCPRRSQCGEPAHVWGPGGEH